MSLLRVIPSIPQSNSSTGKASPKESFIPVLDYLRGFAALAVCVFHFTCGRDDFLDHEDPLKIVGSFGWLGVEAFFVISGCIIPFSMYQRSYRVADAPQFLLRRLKRLEPPYLACIALVMLLQVASEFLPGFRGSPVQWTAGQLAAHLGYANAIVGFEWLNPVFWTLAIEFQFYLAMSLSYVALSAAPRPLGVGLTVIGVAAIGLVAPQSGALLPHWLPLFAMGIAAFQNLIGRLPSWKFAVAIASVASISLLTIGALETAAGAATASIIVIAKQSKLPRAVRPLAWAGIISYSLYLVHVPVGGRIVNFAVRYPVLQAHPYYVVTGALLISVLAAVVFWRLIEYPSQRWSKGRPWWTRGQGMCDVASTLATSASSPQVPCPSLPHA